MSPEGWEERYARQELPALSPVVTGFNINLDRVITLSREMLDDSALIDGELTELRRRLVASMEYCTAAEWIVDDRILFRTATDHFGTTGEISLGGQAGIAALHLARLGVPGVVCLTPAAGRRAAGLLESEGIRVICHARVPDVVHTILEYEPGLVPLVPGAIPRSNRFIISPEKSAGSTLLPQGSQDRIIPQLSSCTRAFLSGYQYLATGEEFTAGADQIAWLRQANPAMRVHVECVSVTDPAVNAGIVDTILPAADSAGMNENELSLLLGHRTGPDPAGLVRDMMVLADRTGLSRIHLHTYGYYLEIRRSGDAIPEKIQDALLFAAKAAADHAGGQGARVTREGVAAVSQVTAAYGEGSVPGITSSGPYDIIAVPALVAREIRRTVGLGDVISASALAATSWKTG